MKNQRGIDYRLGHSEGFALALAGAFGAGGIYVHTPHLAAANRGG